MSVFSLCLMFIFVSFCLPVISSYISRIHTSVFSYGSLSIFNRLFIKLKFVSRSLLSSANRSIFSLHSMFRLYGDVCFFFADLVDGSSADFVTFDFCSRMRIASAPSVSCHVRGVRTADLRSACRVACCRESNPRSLDHTSDAITTAAPSHPWRDCRPNSSFVIGHEYGHCVTFYLYLARLV